MLGTMSTRDWSNVDNEQLSKQLRRSALDGSNPADHVGHGCSFDPEENHLYDAPFDKLPFLEASKKPVVWVERTSPNTITYEFQSIPTEQAIRIVHDVLPKVMELFLQKNKDYGDAHTQHMRLGPKGQFVDIWRKIIKLKRGLWDGEELAGEKPPEIMMDLIGHCLLALLDYEEDAQN